MIKESIIKAEEVHLKSVTDFLASRLENMRLDSHGVDHHLRVWSFAKTLLQEGEMDFAASDSLSTNKLLIACMLHDSGMAVDPGPRHGKLGAENCAAYLASKGLGLSDYADLIEAVEMHDDKEYTGGRLRSNLERILSVADDLDAFGYTGIFRYSEIYLARGTSFSDLGESVLKNVESRFRNLLPELKPVSKTRDYHTARYNILTEFFMRYNNRLKNYTFPSIRPSGECGVAEIIKDNLIHGKPASMLAEKFAGTESDSTSGNYFTSLKEELLRFAYE